MAKYKVGDCLLFPVNQSFVYIITEANSNNYYYKIINLNNKNKYPGISNTGNFEHWDWVKVSSIWKILYS